MRKALVIAILALFGSETLAQHGFRPTTRPGNPPPFNPISSRPILLDSEDNEMFRLERPIGGTPPFIPRDILINRPTLTNTFDDVQDNEMALDLRLPKEPTYRVSFAEDDDEFFAEAPQDDELFGVPMGRGGSGIYASGGSARGGGVAWGGVGQYSHPIGKNTNVFVGAQVSHAPGSRVNIAPHAGIQVRFDDAENDELFVQDAQDDEFYAEAPQDDELFGVPMGRGGSGIYASGGSARGGVAWGGVGQYSHPIGKNTNVFVGAQVSHAPGSRVNIAPHAGIQFRFDDAENDELFVQDAQDDELYAEDDELFGVPMARGDAPWRHVSENSHPAGMKHVLGGGPGSKVNIISRGPTQSRLDDEEN